MTISSCLDPQRVFNKYIGDYITVPCGKCSACLNRKSLKWTDRLDVASLTHQFVLFFTLTYSEDNVPRLYKSSKFHPLDTDKNGLHYEFNDNFINEQEIENCQSYKRYGYVPILSHNDASIFIDYLREISGVPKFQYWIIGEYGSTTYRPHFHGLLFLDNLSDYRALECSISSAWSQRSRFLSPFCSRVLSPNSPLGRVDIQKVRNSANSYVTSYLNCHSDLPRLYQESHVRQFHTQSKSPALGISRFPSQTLRSYVLQSSVVYCKKSLFDGSTTLSPFDDLFEAEFYPRPSIGCIDLQHDVFKHMLCLCSVFCLSWPKENIKYAESFLLSYISSNFTVYGKTLVNRLVRSRRFARRVLANALDFGVSVSDYIDIIVQYYINCDFYKLKLFYEYQAYLVDERHVDSRSLISLYSQTNFNDSNFFDLCTQFGFLPSEFKYFFNFRLSTEFNDYRIKMDKIYLDNTKTKKRNDYLLKSNLGKLYYGK